MREKGSKRGTAMAIRYDKDGNIATITINRPEAMNAMDRDTSRELAEAFEDFDQDEDCWWPSSPAPATRHFLPGPT